MKEIPSWLKKVNNNEKVICSDCLRDIEPGENKYVNKNDVPWCQECAEEDSLE